MSDNNDLSYLTACEKRSRTMSNEPGDIAVQNAHLKMADDYSARISALIATVPIAVTNVTSSVARFDGR